MKLLVNTCRSLEQSHSLRQRGAFSGFISLHLQHSVAPSRAPGNSRQSAHGWSPCRASEASARPDLENYIPGHNAVEGSSQAWSYEIYSLFDRHKKKG